MIALDWPSWIQAASAVIIAAFTVVLVRATNSYVAKTQDLATEARRSNDQAQANTERLLRANAPCMVVSIPGGSEFWQGEYSIQNVGETTAHDVVIVFDTENRHLDQPLRPTAKAPIIVGTTSEVPVPVRSVVFFDPAGTRWVQGSQHFYLDQTPTIVPNEQAERPEQSPRLVTPGAIRTSPYFDLGAPFRDAWPHLPRPRR